MDPDYERLNQIHKMLDSSGTSLKSTEELIDLLIEERNSLRDTLLDVDRWVRANAPKQMILQGIADRLASTERGDAR